VAVFTDVGPVDPTTFGPQLPTHAEIWKVATGLLAARIETFTEDRAEAVLARAEAKLGTRIEQPAVRREMLQVLWSHVAPSLLWRFIVQVLLDNNFSLSVHGEGWHDVLGPVAGGPAHAPAERARIMRQARIVIYADVAGQVTSVPLLAAGSGSVLIARAHPRDTEPGGLHTLLQPGREMLSFSHARELLGHVGQLLGDEPRRRAMADRAYQRCRSDHGPSVRLAALRIAASSLSGGSEG